MISWSARPTSSSARTPASCYGRHDLLNELKAYKVRPASNALPYKFETGTQNHEGIAGVLGAIEYFEWLGAQFGSPQEDGRRKRLQRAQAHLEEGHDRRTRSMSSSSAAALIETVQSVPGTHIYGVTDPRRLDERVPTVSFTLEGRQPRRVAEMLARAGLLRLGWKLLRAGRHRKTGSGGQGRHGARRAGALQHYGGNCQVRHSLGEDRI